MKNFIFISDFDGTLTKKDFYKIITDDYLKNEVESMYKDWINKKIRDVDYLGYVFSHIRRNEEEIYEDIMKISLDPFAKEFINNVHSLGGDFVVVSAGTSYYIEKVFLKNNIENVTVFSNKTIYKDNGLHFVLDKNHEFYSEIYGIDKFLVVQSLKSKYKKVFYAGDSEPDLKPALISDIVFAKGALVDLLKKENKEFIEFENFHEVWQKLQNYI